MGEGSTDTPQGVGRGGTHVPVLLKEAIDFLAVRRGGTYIDATVGLGGHSYEIAKRLGAPGHLIGVDKDPAALGIATERLRAGSSTALSSRERDDMLARNDNVEMDWPSVELRHGSFADLAKDVGRMTQDGILADLGVSSLQFDDPARGFSFQAEGPLDMRITRKPS